MANSPCCVRTAEKWYQSFLAAHGGHHSDVMTRYFLEANLDLAPLFANILGADEFRVAASKAVGQARMQPLICAECGKHIALIILSLPFMLLVFRVQAVFHSMIDRWEIIPEGPDKCRERIHWHKPGSFQVQQLSLALEMYLAEKDVTLEGMDKLVSQLNSGSPEARAVFLEAVRVAESWVVAHEVFHVCLGSQDSEAFPQFAPFAESNQDALQFAVESCRQIAAAARLHPDVAQDWLDEFQADLMACKILCIGIAERRFRNAGTFTVPAKDARFHAARLILNGAAAALDAVYWVDVQRRALTSAEQVRSSSHPPHHLRWDLMTRYMRGITRVEDDALLKITELMAGLSQLLYAAYASALGLQDAVTPPRKSAVSGLCPP